jgi:hypothetical protein
MNFFKSMIMPPESAIMKLQIQTAVKIEPCTNRPRINSRPRRFGIMTHPDELPDRCQALSYVDIRSRLALDLQIVPRGYS